MHKRFTYTCLSRLAVPAAVLSALLMLSDIPVLAQDSLTNNILTTKVFRKGIYRMSDEFRSNTPAITTDFTTEYDTGKYERFFLYQKKKKIRYMYGFSDGKDVYINAKVYGRSNYFVKILILGPIIYFEDQKAKESQYLSGTLSTGILLGGVVGGAIAGAFIGTMPEDSGMNNPGWVVYLADTDGKAYPLDPNTMESILTEADPELLKRFEKEPRAMQKSHKVLFKYLLEFNERAFQKQVSAKK